MTEDRAKPQAVFKKFRFLGQRWRFLKEDIQKESFPGFKKVQLDALNLKSSFMRTEETFSPRDIKATEQVASEVKGQSKTKTNVGRVRDFVTVEELEEQNELLVRLRNAQLFHRNNMYPAECAVEETDTVVSPRISQISTPKAEPSRLIADDSVTTRTAELISTAPLHPCSSSRSSFRAAQSNRKLVNTLDNETPRRKTKDKKSIINIEHLEIGRCFRAYTMEKGHRMPLCFTSKDANSPVVSNQKIREPADNILSMHIMPVEPPETALFPSRPKSKGATLNNTMKNTDSNVIN